ncbi:N-(5'-phosphoribosyl)anthranilate isomerase [Halobacteriales archaeon QS_3_64_16]|nr:MAG: N-(5'-phosphoribosyl)anthranilate isomerase [Halobacteriales archaeon QS_3_64_16]
MSDATRAKICGLTNAEDLTVAIEAGADAVGFVVSVPVDSPREIPSERARDLIEELPPFVTSVVVTMPETPEDARSLVEEIGPDALQVHGTDPKTIEAIGAAVNVPILGAIDAEADIDRFSAGADALLVDSLDAAGAGGTGETGDWAAAREVVRESSVPVILAGGLTPENVGEAVAAVDPFAVDVASGVEERGGRKDQDAVRKFLARAADTRTRSERTVEP